jgi:hypothetical protein
MSIVKHGELATTDSLLVAAPASNNTPRQEEGNAAASTVRLQDIFALCSSRRRLEAV